MTDKLTVVMLVGGRGSRLAPYTDDTPKCLIDVAGKTLLERILDNLQPLFTGFDVNYVFLVDYLGNKVEEYVTSNLDIDAVFLWDKPGADQVSVVLEAKLFVTGAMLLYYGDTVIDSKFSTFPDYDFFFTDYTYDVSQKGEIGDDGKITEKSGKVKPGYIMVGGYYFINGNRFLAYLHQIRHPENISDANNKYQDGFNKMIQMKVLSHSIDDMDDWAIANKYYKEKVK